MRVAKILSALEVKRLTKPGKYAVGEVPGLYLRVTDTGARQWVLKVNIDGVRRETGLGGFPGVTLADARTRARELRLEVHRGNDPIEAKKAAKSDRKAAKARAVTFKYCATAYIASHKAGWKNVKHGDQWTNTLETYAYPVMGELLVRDVAKEHVLQVLQPIWNDKTETAVRIRGRIESVLSYAMQAGYRPEGLNPARWKGGLDQLLPAPGRVATKDHHAAVPVGKVGAFMIQLRACDGIGAKALEFAILTAARSGEVRMATWEEIDLAHKVWVVPAAHMKGKREHRVPLSDAAIELLKALPRISTLVFPSPRLPEEGSKRTGELSDMTLTAVLRRLKIEATAHGFRSTFRDWAAERTNYPGDMAEMALAHVVGSKVEAAYRRGDMFEKRRHMMNAWAEFLSRVENPAKVINLDEKRTA